MADYIAKEGYIAGKYNMDVKVKGNELVIKIDLAAKTFESMSGKTLTIAKSGGKSGMPISLPNGTPAQLSLNMYAYK